MSASLTALGTLVIALMLLLLIVLLSGGIILAIKHFVKVLIRGEKDE